MQPQQRISWCFSSQYYRFICFVGYCVNNLFHDTINIFLIKITKQYNQHISKASIMNGETINHQTISRNFQSYILSTPNNSQEAGSVCSKKSYLLKRSMIKELRTSDKSDFFNVSSLSTIGIDSLSTPMRNSSTINSQTQPKSRLSKIISTKNSLTYNDPYFKAVQNKGKNIGTQTASLPQIEKQQTIKLAINALNKMKKKSQIHENDTYSNIQSNTIQQRNIKKMKRYIKNWQHVQLQRQNYSLLNRSKQKSQQYLIKHNIQLEKAERLVPFQEQLRGREQQYLSKLRNQAKWLRLDQYELGLSLKGKGGPSKPCYQEVYLVEQVYKTHKDKKTKKQQQSNYELRRKLRKTLQRV